MKINSKLDKKSLYYRKLILRSFTFTKKGHIGGAFSSIEILRVIYEKFLKHKPNNFKNKNGKLILSKGHSCLGLYAILADRGFFDKEELNKAYAFNSLLGGHPENHIPGIEFATGSLGHGLSIGAGIAKAYKLKNSNKNVFVIMGDGELNEGSIWEAAMYCSKHKLNNLVAIIDYNKIQSSGHTYSINDLEPLDLKWKSFGFNTFVLDGHDMSQIENKISKSLESKSKPNILICNTVKGKGFSLSENNPDWHYRRLKDEDKLEIENFLK